MPARPLILVVAGLLTASLLGACGDYSNSGSDGSHRALQPFETVQVSTDRLLATGSAHAQSDSSTVVLGVRYDVRGNGPADFRSRSYDFQLDVPMVGSARSIGIVNIIYLRSDRVTSELPGHPTWLLVDPVRLRNSDTILGASANPFVRFGLMTGDALPELALVKGAREADTRTVGPDTIAGQPATHYSTNLDVAQARSNTFDPRTIADLDRYTQTVHAQTLPAEVWVDSQGRLVQLTLVFSKIFGDRGTDTTLTFSDLGAPIPPISAPPQNQVTDLANLFPG